MGNNDSIHEVFERILDLLLIYPLVFTIYIQVGIAIKFGAIRLWR